MSHVLTVKIPHSLQSRLQKAAESQRTSKGSLVRRALDAFLKGIGRQEDDFVERIRKATEAMRLGKKVRTKVNWEELRRKAAVDTGMTPEEEVRYYRRRRQ